MSEWHKGTEKPRTNERGMFQRPHDDRWRRTSHQVYVLRQKFLKKGMMIMMKWREKTFNERQTSPQLSTLNLIVKKSKKREARRTITRSSILTPRIGYTHRHYVSFGVRCTEPTHIPNHQPSSGYLWFGPLPMIIVRGHPSRIIIIVVLKAIGRWKGLFFKNDQIIIWSTIWFNPCTCTSEAW